MGKIAFLFAGQGAQKVGMCKDFYEKFDCCREILDKTDEILGYKISNICFEGTQEELNKTEITQPAVIAANMMCLKAIEHLGIKADVVAGLSLGEYSALIYENIMSYEDVIPLVRKRGKYMQEAVPLGKGAMAAVLNLSDDEVRRICEEASQYGIVECANYNCPGQVAISGEIAGVDKAEELVSKAGGKFVRLSVSGPFHCSLMSKAAEKLNVELQKINVNKASSNVYCNVTGEKYNSSDDVREILTKQVMSSVYFTDTIKNMIDDGVDTFIEIGPGKTLSRFVKRINKNMKIYNVEDLSGLEKLSIDHEKCIV